MRLEQIYPRPLAELNAEIAKYPNAREVRWVQDEPANQGPWPHVALHFSGEFDGLPLVTGLASGVVGSRRSVRTTGTSRSRRS